HTICIANRYGGYLGCFVSYKSSSVSNGFSSLNRIDLQYYRFELRYMKQILLFFRTIAYSIQTDTHAYHVILMIGEMKNPRSIEYMSNGRIVQILYEIIRPSSECVEL